LQSVRGQQGVAYRHIILLALSLKFPKKVATQIAKNCRPQQPYSHLKSPPTGTQASIRKHHIFPETRVIGLHFCCCMYGSIFIQICAVGSKRRTFSAPECVLAAQGRSGSSKVDDFGTNRKRVYDFLLVSHCDLGPILHRFRDMLTYWLKMAYFCYIFATPLSFGALVPYVPLGISR